MRQLRLAIGTVFVVLMFSPGLAAAVGSGRPATSNEPAYADNNRTGADLDTIWIDPETVRVADGATETTFRLPSGTVITAFTPPAGFDPLKADESELTRYAFPLPPSDPDEYKDWYAAMAVYEADDPPMAALQVSESATRYLPRYDIWGGYSVGTLNVQSQKYVAVKGYLTVPANVGTCSISNGVAFWIGLGGVGGTYEPDNLVQQGFACGNTSLGGNGAYRAWTEFAANDPAIPFCGSPWTMTAGHVMYLNMSFQTSQNKGFFYMQDLNSGLTRSCEGQPHAPWHWDLNTAEWIGEAPAGTAIDFDSVHFTNARAELYSNSSWVTLGSQPWTEWIDGRGIVGGRLYSCIDPAPLASTTAFYDYFVGSACSP